MLIVDKQHCSDVCCDEFPVPQIDRKLKVLGKNTVTWKILFAISVGKTRCFKHGKYQNLWMNNRGDYYAICMRFLPYLLNICREFEWLISQGSVATCLR